MDGFAGAAAESPCAPVEDPLADEVAPVAVATFSGRVESDAESGLDESDLGRVESLMTSGVSTDATTYPAALSRQVRPRFVS